MRQLHRENAERFGNQPAKVVTEASAKLTRELSPEKAEQKAHAAVLFARERLGERSAVFDHFEVVRDALRHTQGRATLEDIYAELRQQKEHGNFVEVQHVRPNAPAARYTTPELISIEREAIERVRFGQGISQPIATLTDAEISQRYGHLNEDQRRLVRETLSTQDQVFGIQGKAGTGKTTALIALGNHSNAANGYHLKSGQRRSDPGH